MHRAVELAGSSATATDDIMFTVSDSNLDFYCLQLRVIMWFWMPGSVSKCVYLQIPAKVK